MKSEAEPITDDEFVLRLIWHEYFTPGPPATVSDSAFTPRTNEPGGISLFRASCLADPEEALMAIASEKRPRYAIAALLVADLRGQNLTISPKSMPPVTGHAELEDLTSVSWKADKAKWRPMLRRLAELAQANIVRWPSQ
jgi:hypothetical protein